MSSTTHYTPSILIIEGGKYFTETLYAQAPELDFTILYASSLDEGLELMKNRPVQMLVVSQKIIFSNDINPFMSGSQLKINSMNGGENSDAEQSNGSKVTSTSGKSLQKENTFFAFFLGDGKHELSVDDLSHHEFSVIESTDNFLSWLAEWKVSHHGENGSPAKNKLKFKHQKNIVNFDDRVLKQINRVSDSYATVLIYGESGTGKEVVAQQIHEASSRADAPFIPVNSGAISTSLIESELFGHEAGSFTGATQRHIGCFEQADGGTLFLDEITEMPKDLQVKLLRVLETSRFRRVGGRKEIQVDVRIIAATNCDPKKAVQVGKLREDLYYRLNVFPIVLSPLREQPELVFSLANHFIDELNESYQCNKTMTDECTEGLHAYHWPGNIRELRNAIHRAFLMSDTSVEEVIENWASANSVAQPSNSNKALSFQVGTPLSAIERAMIKATLLNYQGDKPRTAKALGISLKTLYNRLAQDKAMMPESKKVAS